MAKYIPLSLVLMTIILPGILAGRPRAKQAMRSVQTWMAIYIVIWGLLCLYVYTRHVFIE